MNMSEVHALVDDYLKNDGRITDPRFLTPTINAPSTQIKLEFAPIVWALDHYQKEVERLLALSNGRQRR